MLNKYERNFIIDTIFRDFEWLEYTEESCDIERNLYEFVGYNNDYRYDAGATKVCIFSEYFSDYVVKISTTKFDYCEREYINYKAAKEEKLEKYFPWTDYLCNINGYKLFIQEKVYSGEDAEDETYRTLSNYVDRSFDWDEEDDEYSREDAIRDVVCDLSDKDRVKIIFNDEELSYFLRDYVINDIHEGNIGYRGNDPVILDFSGYGRPVVERDEQHAGTVYVRRDIYGYGKKILVCVFQFEEKISHLEFEEIDDGYEKDFERVEISSFIIFYSKIFYLQKYEGLHV